MFLYFKTLFFATTMVLKDNLHVFPVFSVLFSSLKNDDLKSLLLLLMGKLEKWGENESFLLMITTHMQTTKNNYSWSFLHMVVPRKERGPNGHGLTQWSEVQMKGEKRTSVIIHDISEGM